MRPAQPQRLHHDILLNIGLTCASGPQWLHDGRRDGMRSIRIRVGAMPCRLCPWGPGRNWGQGRGRGRGGGRGSGRISKAGVRGRFAVSGPGRRQDLGQVLLHVEGVQVGACGVQGVQHGLKGVLYLLRDVRTRTGCLLWFGVVEAHRQSSSTKYVQGHVLCSQGQFRERKLSRTDRTSPCCFVVMRYAARAALSHPPLRDAGHIPQSPVSASGSPRSSRAWPRLIEVRRP
jgi:hypothetical protein